MMDIALIAAGALLAGGTVGASVMALVAGGARTALEAKLAEALRTIRCKQHTIDWNAIDARRIEGERDAAKAELAADRAKRSATTAKGNHTRKLNRIAREEEVLRRDGLATAAFVKRGIPLPTSAEAR